MGHVGWGFLTDPAKKLYCFGSTENLSGKPFVDPGQDNSAWFETGSLRTMLSTMKAGHAGAEGYDDYKRNWVEPIHAKRAYEIAATRHQVGYRVVGLPGNNCADHSYDILAAYGVTGLPFLQALPGPNAWFQALIFGWDYFSDVSPTCEAIKAEDAPESAIVVRGESLEGGADPEAEGKLRPVKPRRPSAGGGDSPKNALPTTVGSTVEGELAAGAARHYKLDLKDGDIIKFTIYSRLKNGDNYASGTFAIQDEEGGVLGETNFLIKATGEDFTRERYEFEAEEAGTYIFRIRSEDKDAEQVTYKIKL